jgi:hypothetical protein
MLWAMKLHRYLAKLNLFSRVIGLLLIAPAGYAENTWTFTQANDPLNNRVITSVVAPRSLDGVYDNIKLSLVCSDNKLQVALNSDALITSQGSFFDVEYQIDKNVPVKIRMQTFPDSKRKGFTDEYAKAMLDSMLSGNTLFLKVNTMIRKVLTTAIPLDGASPVLNKVLTACAGTAETKSAPTYSFEVFAQEFNALSPDKQQLALQKIKMLMQELHQ